MEKALVFNVEEAQNTSDWVTYKHFIERFRRSFPVTSYIWERPFMADIVLQTYSHEIRLRLNRCNFYLEGYQMEDPEQWLEFGTDYIMSSWKRRGMNTFLYHEIVGSSFLNGFSQDYCNLECKIKETTGHAMDSLNLGQQPLITAVNLLSTSMTTRDRAWSLIVVMLMICEGLRFDSVCNYVSATFLDSLPPPAGMLQLIRRYNCLHRLPEGGNLGFDLSFRENSSQNRSAGDSPISKYAEYTGRWAAKRHLNHERTLVEVFLVTINSINGEESGKFYGTITATDRIYSECIYHREKNDAETLSYGDTLLLTGPTRALWGDDLFGINLELMGENVPEIDDNYCGQITWDFRDYDGRRHGCKCDEPLVDDFDGKYCSVTVSFIVFEYAVQANVEVTLLIDDVAHVYGSIYARCDEIEFDYRSVLFRIEAKEPNNRDVRPGELIKLSRSVVAVDVDCTLLVRADLYDYNGDLSSDDDAIARGTAKFPVQLSGSFEEIIYGNCGQIRVRVTFE